MIGGTGHWQDEMKRTSFLVAATAGFLNFSHIEIEVISSYLSRTGFILVLT